MAFCEQELGLTKDQAWKRSQAAGAIEKEPELLAMLSRGATSVSALAMVAPKLSSKTAAEIKAFVPQKSKREVEAFLSNLNKDGTRNKKPQTIKLTLSVSLETAEKFRHAAKLLRQNKPELTDDEVMDAAFELLLDKKDPVRKAIRIKARQHQSRQKAKTSPGQTQGPSKQKHHSSKSEEQKKSSQHGRYIPAAIQQKGLHNLVRGG